MQSNGTDKFFRNSVKIERKRDEFQFIPKMITAVKTS